MEKRNLDLGGYEINHELSVKVYTPISRKSVTARFIPLKKEIPRDDTLSDFSNAYFIVNLDIYEGDFKVSYGANRKAVEFSDDEQAIVTIIHRRRRGDDEMGLLFYLDGWVKQEDLLANAERYRDRDNTEVSRLFYDDFSNEEYGDTIRRYWFAIKKWPSDDRLICGNN